MGLPFLGSHQRAFTILLGAATASSYLSCSSNSPDTPVIPPPGQGPRVELHTQSLQSRTADPVDLTEGPGFAECLTTIPNSLYSKESALRLRICFSDPEQAQKLQKQWNALQGESRPLGDFQTGSSQDLLDALAEQELQFFYDGNSDGALADLAEIHERSRASLLASRFLVDRYRDRILSQYSGVLLSPRSFPNAVFSFVLSKDALFLIFPSTYSRRLHWLPLSLPPETAEELSSRLHRHHRKLREKYPSTNPSESSQLDPIRIERSITELYNRAQLELRCDRNGRTRFLFRTDDKQYDQVLPCKEDALLLLKRDAKRKIAWIEDSSTRISVPHVAKGRSLNWTTVDKNAPASSASSSPDSTGNPGSGGFWSLQACNPQCQTLGWIPDNPHQKDVPVCKLDHLKLKEWNLIGLLTPKLKPGGRFLEFEVLQNCRPSGLRIQSGDQRILFEDPVLQKGLYVVLVDPALFSLPADISRQTSYLLRRISQDDAVQLVNLISGNSRTIVSPSGKTPLIGHARGHTHIQALHSNQSETFNSLHPPYCVGLIPDLCQEGWHGMSPGHRVKASPLASIQIDEILPAGTSEPSEEFLEFRNAKANPGKEFLAGHLEIEFRSEHRDYQFLRPLPRNVPGRWAIMRQGSACYQGRPSILEDPDFRIPNEAFRMTVTLHANLEDGSEIHQNIVNRWFDERFQSRQHSHLVVKRRSNVHWLSHATNSCHASSPGSAGHYRPKLLARGSQGMRLEWLADSAAKFQLSYPYREKEAREFWLAPGLQPLNVWEQPSRVSSIIELEQTGNVPNQVLTDEGPNRSSGSPEAPRWRFRIWHQSGMDSRCRVQTVHRGEPEWLRICFPEGASRDVELFIQDEQSIDRLVPARERNSSLQAMEASTSRIGLNECVLIVDPDLASRSLLLIDKPEDRSWLMPESGSALGNGLREDESIRIRIQQPSRSEPAVLCTFGKGLRPYHRLSGPEKVGRIPGTYQDLPGNFRYGFAQ